MNEYTNECTRTTELTTSQNACDIALQLTSVGSVASSKQIGHSYSFAASFSASVRARSE